MGFDRLHSAVQHHVVNTLGWPKLRPLQEEAVDVLMDGKDAILLAPTAGGKTEAAVFPVYSRMLQEDWKGLSVLYVCPIKALLNNLYERLHRFGGLLGRRVELWHGDVNEGFRKRIRQDPPDILLTTPESIEAILTSTKSQPGEFFRAVRTVIIDEVHAFAGDDRGWHLLGVLSRVERLAGCPLQRIGLSATVGNPDELLHWLSPAGREGVVLNPPAEVATEELDVTLDFVGSLENAAMVIARLHRGEKRLVFSDSRARVEKLALLLRERKVTTFVSHSSLGVQQRRDAEQAFAGGSDCVIVATSTLELGIDVGDLDRVIQIDAPATVASFLQRLGRTGRREGSKRNCLFLATKQDALLRAAALLRLWRRGFIEPVVPPPAPLHILAQQIMGLALQRKGVTREDWVLHLSVFLEQAGLRAEEGREIIEEMLTKGLFVEDEGILWFGPEGERTFGRRHFMGILAVFVSEPLFTVLNGRMDLGAVHPLSLVGDAAKSPLSLGGRAWKIVDIDWNRKRVSVVPTEGRGTVRWMGDAAPLGFDMCQAVLEVLADDLADDEWSSRATASMLEAREDFSFAQKGTTVLQVDSDQSAKWWTFGGLLANAQLARALESLGFAASADNLLISLERAPESAVATEALRVSLEGLQHSSEELASLAEKLKFRECLTGPLLERVLRARCSDAAGVERLEGMSVREFSESE